MSGITLYTKELYTLALYNVSVPIFMQLKSHEVCKRIIVEFSYLL
jgi:hypothetical protein